MALQQETFIQESPASDIVKVTILSAFTFLSALSLRDLLMKTMENCVPKETSERLVFTYAYASLVLAITILLAVTWNASAKRHEKSLR